jgi:serine/threonine protein kinase
MNAMNCPKCNTPIPGDAAFCPNCGMRAAVPASSGPRTMSGLATIAPMIENRASVLEPGTRFAERYEVISKIGEGGMGIVYVAKDTNTSEEIVLKLIHPDLVKGEEAIKRLMAEGLTARQIRHPKIVAVYDVSQWNGQPYFTMEYVRGGTMRSWIVECLNASREISVEIAAGLMKSMLAGLAEAHRMGVIHRDLKPENVLLCGDPQAGNYDLKILDFGIAKAVGGHTTRGGGAIGTPPYMAPEQTTSPEAVGPAADLYSLSAMFYELLMDSPPQGLRESVTKSRPDVPKAIDDLIEKGLAQRARNRPASAAEYSAAIDAALPGGVHQDGPGPKPPQPPPHPPPHPPDGRGLWASMSPAKKWIIGIAVVVLVGIIGNMMDNPGPPEPTPTPTPTGAVWNASGYWIDQLGDRFTVRHDGLNFTAQGMVMGVATELRGQLTTAGAQFVLTFATGVVLQGTGQVYPDGNNLPHLRFQLSDGTGGDFKINHTN